MEEDVKSREENCMEWNPWIYFEMDTKITIKSKADGRKNTAGVRNSSQPSLMGRKTMRIIWLSPGPTISGQTMYQRSLQQPLWFGEMESFSSGMEWLTLDMGFIV